MTTAPPSLRQDRKWYGLSLRHLRMSLRLLRRGFADGSYFHAYHAFECAVSAVIAAKGFPVPPDGKAYTKGAGRKGYYNGPGGPIYEASTHKSRLILFDQVADRSKPYYGTYSTLKRILTNKVRSDTLYYDSVNDLLPWQHFNHSLTQGLYQQVRSMVSEVREEIP